MEKREQGIALVESVTGVEEDRGGGEGGLSPVHASLSSCCCFCLFLLYLSTTSALPKMPRDPPLCCLS
jgi:hypothetical protein